MDYQEVLDKKIAFYEKRLQELRGRLNDPNTHADLLSNQLSDLSSQISQIDLPEDVKEQFIGVLSRIPDNVISNWRWLLRGVEDAQRDLDRTKEARDLYAECVEEERLRKKKAAEARKKKKEINSALKEKIEAGEIEEPSSTTARKRKRGTKPPTSLRKYRNLKGSEDSGK